MTAKEFYEKHIGKGIDIDGAYGIQCVDLFKCFTKEMYGIYNYNCGNGYASGLWLNRKSKPYYSHFIEVSVNNLQDGDWCFWNNGSRDCPDSHVAMYYQGKFFGQNQGGKRYATLINISKSGMLGALRPKEFKQVVKQVNITGADQVLYKGSKVRFNGSFKVDILRSPLSTNMFGCTALTGVSFNTYRSNKVKEYHWIPANDFDEVNGDGILTGGSSWVTNNHVYNVEDIDIPSNSAKLIINGHAVWVFSKYLYEVSNF